ncbi:hypothetical protein Y032_0010g939 [Ancylostoma ceylanicum]|nr:hypothetical protein Y032_0010g939 [Ancylostoma ceylanicum]
MLLLVMKHGESEKITKLGRKAPRNSTLTVDDNDSGACGAVARRPCRARGWVTAIDAHSNHTIYHNLRPKAESELYLLPPNYEEATTNLCHLHMYEDRGSSSDRRNTADSTLHITHKDNTPDNTLHVTTKDAMVHLHV